MGRLTRKIRELRTKLWRVDAKCRNCGVITILPEHIAHVYKLKPDKLFTEAPLDAVDVMATVQHEVSRLREERRTLTYADRTTLYCHRCNQQDADSSEQVGWLASQKLSSKVS